MASQIIPLSSGTLDSATIGTILDAIGSNAITGISAPTGIGKSTTLVKAIHEVCEIIFVVEPNIFAVDNLTTYMSRTLGKDVVGSAFEAKVRYENDRIDRIRPKHRETGKNTAVVYTTGGHMRRLILDLIKYGYNDGANDRWNDGTTQFCDVLMIDEVHNRTVDNDVIMALYNYMTLKGADLPRLVLASATFDPQSLPFPEMKLLQFSVPLRITYEYHTHSFDLGDRNLLTETAQMILGKHRSHPPEASSDDSHPPGESHLSDEWLVFCSGVNEVDLVADTLEEAKTGNLEIVRAHGQIGASTIQDRISQPVPRGYRRVIVATNIAESAVTFNNLSGVFDTLIEKYTETSASGGPLLIQNFVSISSANQRAGRTGRTRPGFCYRMTTEDAFKTFIPQRPPEIDRIPLDSIVMELLDAHVNPKDLFEDRIAGRFELAIRVLKDLGMITTEPFAITDLGHFVPQVPFSVRGAAVIYHALKSSKPIFPILVAMCLIECYHPSYFFYPHRGQRNQREYLQLLERHYTEFFHRYNGPTDLHVLLNLFLSLYDRFPTLTPNPWKLSQYCRDVSLNGKKVIEFFKLLVQAINAIRSLNYDITIALFDPDDVMNQLLPLFKQIYADRVYTYQGSSTYIGTDVKGLATYYAVDEQSPLRLPLTYPLKILALTTYEIHGQRRAQFLIGLSIPFDLERRIILPPLPSLEELSQPSEVKYTPSNGFRIVDEGTITDRLSHLETEKTETSEELEDSVVIGRTD